LTAAKAALQTVLHFVRPLAGEPVVVAAPGVAVTVAPVSMAVEGPMQSRAHALAQLRAVADFFRRTEPHSPVAYLADKAAHWGEQPLHVWLRAVVKDDAAFAQFEDLLGLQGDAA